MAGSATFPPRRLALSLLVWLGGSAAFFFFLQGSVRFHAIAFFLVAFWPLGAAFLFPAGAGESFRRNVVAALATPLLSFPFLLAAALSGGPGLAPIGGIWILGFSCIFFCLGLGSFLSRRTGVEAFSLPAVASLSALSLGGVWGSAWFDSPVFERLFVRINPLSALSDHLGLDWVRDGELYFRSHSVEPIGYPDWRWYAGFAFLGGALWFALSKAFGRPQAASSEDR